MKNGKGERKMSVETKPKQNTRILDYLAENGSITQIEALNKLGVLRLASRISDLRRKGYDFDSEMITVRNQWGEKCRVKRYSLREVDG